MKVFDYTDGKRGNLLKEIKLANSSDGWLVKKDQKVYKVELSKKDGCEWAKGATYYEDGKNIKILPENFGVEAVCFCLGKWSCGIEKGSWKWIVIGSKEWNVSSCKAGILKSTYLHG
jgi:hypothetical protein